MPKPPKPGEPDPGEKKHADELLDEALEESFPASDPVANTVIDGVLTNDGPKKKRK